MEPDILTVTIDNETSSFLTGSFPVPEAITKQILKVAQLSDRIACYLDVMAKGMEAIESAWRDAYKQSMIWREELETCGQQHGSK